MPRSGPDRIPGALRNENVPIPCNPITLPPDRVAQIGYRGFMRGKRVVIAGLGNKIVVFLLRLIPNALLLRAVDMRTRADSS